LRLHKPSNKLFIVYCRIGCPVKATRFWQLHRTHSIHLLPTAPSFHDSSPSTLFSHTLVHSVYLDIETIAAQHLGDQDKVYEVLLTSTGSTPLCSVNGLAVVRSLICKYLCAEGALTRSSPPFLVGTGAPPAQRCFLPVSRRCARSYSPRCRTSLYCTKGAKVHAMPCMSPRPFLPVWVPQRQLPVQ